MQAQEDCSLLYTLAVIIDGPSYNNYIIPE